MFALQIPVHSAEAVGVPPRAKVRRSATPAGSSGRWRSSGA